MREPVLVEAPTLQPGRCFCCGTVAGPMVDTMVETFDGRVYVCVATCLTPMARLAGLGPIAELEQKLADGQVVTEALQAKLDEQQPLIDAFEVAAASARLASWPARDTVGATKS